MNYGQIIDELRDLGFEEDSTMDEYKDIIWHAVNRATWTLYDVIVVPFRGWYKRELSTEETEWSPVRPPELDEFSDEEFEIGLPDNLLRPCALLSAYYLWLDDDEVKAVHYYNQYEAYINALKEAFARDVRGTVISMGWGW